MGAFLHALRQRQQATGLVGDGLHGIGLQSLQPALRQQQADFYAGCVGLTLPILFTGPGRHPGQVAGRSPFLQPVHVMGNSDLIGQEVLVRITAAHPNSLAGTLSQERQRA